MAGVAHRVTACYDCLLEDLDADAAARRVLERLFVLDGEVVLFEIERLQRRVAPETLRESGSSFGTEVVSPQVERGHGAAHKRLAQLGDIIEAAELVFGQIQRLQRGVALEALGESGSSLGTEAVDRR